MIKPMTTTLNPEDLRVGNLVTDEWHPDIPNIITVESINKKGINLEITDDGNWSELAQHFITPYHTFEQLRPIPLTEEWLLKLGFEKHTTPNYYWINWGTNGISIVFLHSGYNLFAYELAQGHSKILESVHQLQNVFNALTGQELTLKE